MPRIDTGLPDIGAAFEWAIVSKGRLYTAQVPIKSDGSFETGGFHSQVTLTLANLDKTLKAAGSGLEKVAQVLVYLTDSADVKQFNDIYREFMHPPFPNRALFVVSALAVPGMKVELVVYADV